MATTVRQSEEEQLEVKAREKLKAVFGKWGLLAFEKGLSFSDAQNRWRELCQKDAEALEGKMGGSMLARFAAGVKMRREIDAKIQRGEIVNI